MLSAFRRDRRMKGCGLPVKMLVLIVITFFVFSVNTSHTYGYTAYRGTVVTKSGKVRKDASTTSPFVFGVTKDESVVIIGEKKGDDGKLWYQIKVLDSVGYIRSDLIKKSNIEVKSESTIAVEDDKKQPSDSGTDKTGNSNANKSPATGTSTPTVKGTNVIVREEPSTKSGIRVVVQNGQVLNIITTTDKDSDGKTWCQVSFTKGNNNYKGYIRSDLINMNGAAVPTGDAAGNTQDNTGAASTAAPQGTVQNVTLDKPQLGKIKGMGVNIRKEPVDGKVVGRLSTGTPITCTGQVYSDKDGQVWCAVSFVYNKKPATGYVRIDFTDEITVASNLGAKQDPNAGNTGNVDENTNSHNENNASEPVTSESSASIKGIGVRIREKAVNGNIICQLDTGYPIEILEETEQGDGYKWYKIRFSKHDTVREGYVRSDLVSVVTSNYQTALSDEDFEKQIAELPESYKPSLRALHEKYPNWQFVPVNTGLDWNDVVAAESRVGKNLVAKSSIASWKSTLPQAYDWASNTWYGFDGGSWASASTELIQYYLDPRNFLDNSGIFQFETLGFEEYQTVEGIQKLLSGSFMSGNFTDSDGADRSYANTFYDVGREYGISPYHLAARAVQEQGVRGTSQSISGNVPGRENLYNYFNIGAYAAGGVSATYNGLTYASQSDEAYMRPWNTRYKSIAGSAKYISDKYISVGQNTLYFQKFNVVNKTNGYYSHQYMSNIVAASSESARLKNAHTDLNTRLVFRIPYYNNMPAVKCVKPTSDSNPNTYLKNLWVEGYSFNIPFSSITDSYYIQVDSSITSINVGAEAVSGSSSIGGTGNIEINQGENKVQVTCKAQNGSTKIYTIVVNRP